MTESTAATTTTAPSRADAVDWLALGAALLTVVLWASAFVGIRAVADDLSPGSFALGRLLVASAALGVIVAIRRPGLPTRGRDWALIAVSGVVWFGGYFIALNAGEGLVDAGTAAMLVNVGPILIAMLAGLFLHEGFPPRLVMGSAIAFTGTLIIGVASGSQSGQENAPLGVALCLLAAVAYAIGVTVQKPALARVPALSVTAIACAIGAVVTLPFAPLLVEELGAPGRDRLDRLPRDLPDRHCLHDLGVRAESDDGRPAREHDLPRAAGRHRPRLAGAERGAAGAGLRRGSPVHRWGDRGSQPGAARVRAHSLGLIPPLAAVRPQPRCGRMRSREPTTSEPRSIR